MILISEASALGAGSEPSTGPMDTPPRRRDGVIVSVSSSYFMFVSICLKFRPKNIRCGRMFFCHRMSKAKETFFKVLMLPRWRCNSCVTRCLVKEDVEDVLGDETFTSSGKLSCKKTNVCLCPIGYFQLTWSGESPSKEATRGKRLLKKTVEELFLSFCE